jgi:hypothetical protein
MGKVLQGLAFPRRRDKPAPGCRSRMIERVFYAPRVDPNLLAPLGYFAASF